MSFFKVDCAAHLAKIRMGKAGGKFAILLIVKQVLSTEDIGDLAMIATTAGQIAL